MASLFKKIGLTIAIFATCVFALNTFLHGNAISFLSQETYNGISFYKINLDSYLKNITIAFGEISNDLKLELPTLEFTDDIVNNLKVIVNTLLFIANLLIFIIKIPFLVLKELLALFGFVITQTYYEEVNGVITEINNDWWLYAVVNNILSWQIPYI